MIGNISDMFLQCSVLCKLISLLELHIFFCKWIYLYKRKVDIKGQNQCKFFKKSVFFGLKFSLNLLEYETKGFIHEIFFFLFNFAFFLRRVARLSYSTQNFKRVFLETRFFKTARTITRTILNIFFSNFNHIFQTTF